MGAEYAYSTFSARTALYLILKAHDLNRDDEVIVQSFVCPAVMDALLTAQVKPVLVDIDPVSYTMDIDHLNRAISPKTKAMIPVHTYGHPCDMDALCEIARDKESMLSRIVHQQLELNITRDWLALLEIYLIIVST